MDAAQGKPVWKRRRWLVIAIALFVLVSVGTWAFWSRVDPRLIGEWELAAGDSESVPLEFRLEIRADGLVDHVSLPAQGHGPGRWTQVAGPQRFKVSGDQFEISDDGAEGVTQVVVRLYNLIRGRRAHVYAAGRIVSVEGEKLVLWFEHWGELEFVRVPGGTLGRGCSRGRPVDRSSHRRRQREGVGSREG